MQRKEGKKMNVRFAHFHLFGDASKNRKRKKNTRDILAVLLPRYSFRHGIVALSAVQILRRRIKKKRKKIIIQSRAHDVKCKWLPHFGKHHFSLFTWWYKESLIIFAVYIQGWALKEVTQLGRKNEPHDFYKLLIQKRGLRSFFLSMDPTHA